MLQTGPSNSLPTLLSTNLLAQLNPCCSLSLIHASASDLRRTQLPDIHFCRNITVYCNKCNPSLLVGRVFPAARFLLLKAWSSFMGGWQEKLTQVHLHGTWVPYYEALKLTVGQSWQSTWLNDKLSPVKLKCIVLQRLSECCLPIRWDSLSDISVLVICGGLCIYCLWAQPGYC